MTVITLLKINNIRKKTQKIYFSNEFIEKSDFIPEKTVMISNLENFDLSGDGFKRYVKAKTNKNPHQLGLIGLTILPSFEKMWKYFSQKQEIELINRVFKNNGINCISKIICPKKAIDDRKFDLANYKLVRKMELNLSEEIPNSGYGFIYFESVKKAKNFQKIMTAFFKNTSKFINNSSNSRTFFKNKNISALFRRKLVKLLFKKTRKNIFELFIKIIDHFNINFCDNADFFFADHEGKLNN